MEKPLRLKLEKSSRPRRINFPTKKPDSLDRKLVVKKFLTGRTVALVFAVSAVCFAFVIAWIRDLPVYVIAVMALPLLFLILHKVYGILCDLKLLFRHGEDYDVTINSPRGRRWPTVSFVIPSYQEPFAVAKMTFDSVVNAPYGGKKEIIVVDNSRDIGSEDFLNWKEYVENFNLFYPNLNVTAKFVYNTERATLKPGNLDLAQQSIEEGEFAVILDVDSTLPDTGDLLQQAVAQFETDHALGFIQFRIKATNRHFNNFTEAVAISQNLLRSRQIFRGYGGYKIFEGHNGIWRKTVLDEIGEWTQYYGKDIMITEDILKTADMYAKGYYGKSMNVETGEWVPSSLKALEGMWMRWMYGNSQVFFKCFKKIYSKKTSFVEKVDISYHILHHLTTMCFFVVAFSFQLLVPGQLTNLFIFSMLFAPQLIAVAISCLTSRDDTDNLPFVKRLQHAYAGFFLVDTFVMYTQVKSDLKFMLGVSQGWKVTEKGLETSMSWANLLRNKSFHFSMILVSVSVCAVSWVINYDMQLQGVWNHAALLFLNFNLLLSIVVFAKSGRKEHNNVASEINTSNLTEKVFEKAHVPMAVPA